MTIREYLKTLLQGVKTYVDEKIVKSDWDVNDETDPAFIKNRPFYGDGEELIFTITPDEFVAGTQCYMENSVVPGTITELPESVNVYFEGKTYSNITGTMTQSDPEQKEYEQKDENGNWLFTVQITYAYAGSYAYHMTCAYKYEGNTGTKQPTENVKLSFTNGEIKKIDPKYLPDNIGGGDSLPVGSEVLVDADAEVPEGWEVVDEKYDASEVYLPDGQTIETALNNKLDKAGGEITGDLSVSGTIAAPDGNNIGGQRLNNSHIGFFPTHEDALNNTNRKGWIGVADTGTLTIDAQASSSLRFQVKSGSGLEWYSAGTTYIDFHTNWTTSDYSQRLLAPATGNMVAYPGISNGSDRRLKKDIEDIDEKYLNVLKGLSTKTFKYIRWDDGLKIGFIAQDVEEVLKENGIEDMPIIAQNGEDGTYTLDYSQIAPLIVYGWQNHEQRIIEQQTEIDALKSELSELKDLVNKLINTKEE